MYHIWKVTLLSTCVSIKACKNILNMPLREERVVLHNKRFTVQTKYERMWGPELAGLETLKAIQATMFKVTEDVSCCTEECMQALETLYFWWDMVWMFCALIQAKFEYQIQYCFEFLALNVTVKMSYETQCSTMKFINSTLEGMWLVQLNLDLTNLYMMKSSV